MHNLTINEAIESAKQILLTGELTDPSVAKFEAKRLMEYATKYSSAQLIVNASKVLDDEHAVEFQRFVYQRHAGKPLAYIIGEADFWDLTLNVNESTLIPRSDTETMIEAVLELELPELAKVIDLGTGTGAIALTLKKLKPQWQIIGLDKVPDAVELAQSNAKRNKLDVKFQQSDWFSQVGSEQFDLIVSNPPYVEPNSEYLNQGDLRFEPDTALVAEENGLADIKKIVEDAQTFINKNGFLVIEHGHEQAESVALIFKSYGFTEIKNIEDINSKPRVTIGKWLP